MFFPMPEDGSFPVPLGVGKLVRFDLFEDFFAFAILIITSFRSGFFV
jgi:hypothetical protein